MHISETFETAIMAEVKRLQVEAVIGKLDYKFKSDAAIDSDAELAEGKRLAKSFEAKLGGRVVPEMVLLMLKHYVAEGDLKVYWIEGDWVELIEAKGDRGLRMTILEQKKEIPEED